MTIVEVFLPNVAKVREFVTALSPLDGIFDLFSDRYVIDAKSIMGIFGFDLTKPLKLRIYNDTPENMAVVAPFMDEGADGHKHEETEYRDVNANRQRRRTALSG